MKDDDFKTLIKNSTIKTSDNFTDDLMMKLEAERASLSLSEKPASISLGFPILIILGIGITFLFLWVSGLLPVFNFFNYHLNFGSIPFMIIILMAILIGVNHLLKLQNQASSYSNL